MGGSACESCGCAMSDRRRAQFGFKARQSRGDGAAILGRLTLFVLPCQEVLLAVCQCQSAFGGRWRRATVSAPSAHCGVRHAVATSQLVEQVMASSGRGRKTHPHGRRFRADRRRSHAQRARATLRLGRALARATVGSWLPRPRGALSRCARPSRPRSWRLTADGCRHVGCACYLFCRRRLARLASPALATSRSTSGDFAVDAVARGQVPSKVARLFSMELPVCAPRSPRHTGATGAQGRVGGRGWQSVAGAAPLYPLGRLRLIAASLVVQGRGGPVPWERGRAALVASMLPTAIGIWTPPSWWPPWRPSSQDAAGVAHGMCCR